MYALAATAAGVSLLALTSPAECKIVHKVVNQQLPLNDDVLLDLNNDSLNDFSFHLTSRPGGSEAIFHTLRVRGLRQNEVVSFVSHKGSFSFHCAKALPRGAKISVRNQFYAKALMGKVDYMLNFGTYNYCTWQKATQGYVGLKFFIGSKTHFAWARFTGVSLGIHGKAAATFIDYAYETVPNKPIIAGQTKDLEPDDNADAAEGTLFAPARQPATLGILAVGAPALSIWRREEVADATQ
jgi:hypothetical protein